MTALEEHILTGRLTQSSPFRRIVAQRCGGGWPAMFGVEDGAANEHKKKQRHCEPAEMAETIGRFDSSSSNLAVTVHF
jgi:hypothetical protein